MTLSTHTDINRLKIAVVVPIYNAPAVVASCVDALLRFTHPNVKLIFVDDASTASQIGTLLASAEKKHNVSCFASRDKTKATPEPSTTG